jgi:hypothetical protein
MVTGQRCGMGIGRCNRLCHAATGHLSMSIKDRSLHGP